MDVNAESKLVRTPRANDADDKAATREKSRNGSSRPDSDGAQAIELGSEHGISRVHRIITGGNDAPGEEPSSTGGSEIPTYNLAENILAEHRRSAAKRRKAPSRVPPRPKTPPVDSKPKPQASRQPSPVPRVVAAPKVCTARQPAPSQSPTAQAKVCADVSSPQVLAKKASVRPPGAERLSQDLLELQRVVVEIVARDVDRLCGKLRRPSCT